MVLGICFLHYSSFCLHTLGLVVSWCVRVPVCICIFLSIPTCLMLLLLPTSAYLSPSDPLSEARVSAFAAARVLAVGDSLTDGAYGVFANYHYGPQSEPSPDACYRRMRRDKWRQKRAMHE